jgi:hypothetical protein
VADDQENEHGQNADGSEAPTDPAGNPGDASSSQDARIMFTPAQQEYVNKIAADERRSAVAKFKDSDEFKSLEARARRADELEGTGRQEVEDLTEQLNKAKAERASALAGAEAALMRAQFTALLTQRGVPAERHQDAYLLADKSGIKVSLNEGAVTGAEESVQSLIESRPWLVGMGIAPQTTQATRPAPKLNGGTHGTPATEEARIAAAMAEMQARGMGRI